MGRYKPLKGSSYIELPAKIRHTHGILNIQNKDDKCFLWSILASIHEVKSGQHGYRVDKYIPYETELDMSGISYPVAVKDVPTFEQQNNISVNVFGYEEGYYPLYISRNQRVKHINLLLIEKDGSTHYCLIKDLNKMLYSQTKYKGRKYFCPYCLHGFTREDLLIKHKPLYEKHGLQCTVMPEDKDMKFKDIAKMVKVPFVIYADFECIFSKLANEEGKIQIHKPCGYAYMVFSVGR